MLHKYPLPEETNASSIEWLFVADTLNFSFWALEEDHHYTVELHGQKYTGMQKVIIIYAFIFTWVFIMVVYCK